MNVVNTAELRRAVKEFERIRSLRESGNVLRYHTQQTIKQNSIAAHSWGVAALILILNPRASKELIAAALFHDAGELISGDTPYTSKLLDSQLSKSLKTIETNFLNEQNINFEGSLTLDEHLWLKACDMLDLVFFCLDEIEMGNDKIYPVLQNGISALQGSQTPEIILHILDIIEEELE